MNVPKQKQKQKRKDIKKKGNKRIPERPVPVPGGKALERLHQFERARDLEQTDIKKP